MMKTITKIAGAFVIVAGLCTAATSCQKTDRDSRAQGRQPRAARAERNRGRAQRLGRASCEPHNHRATAEDRDVDLDVFNDASMHESDGDLSG